MEMVDKGIRIEEGRSVLADVQARELELEKVLDEARGEAASRIERAKAEAAEKLRLAHEDVERRRKAKVAAIADEAKAEADAIRRDDKAALEELRSRIGAGIPRAVAKAVRVVLPDGFIP